MIPIVDSEANADAPGNSCGEEAGELVAELGTRAALSSDEILRTFQRAFGSGGATTATQRGPTALSIIHLIPWERTARGAIRRSYKNAMLAVRALGLEGQRNTFSDKVVLRNAQTAAVLPFDYVGALTDNAINLVRKKVQDTFGFDPGKELLLDAVKSLAEEARYDPVKDWLETLKWDGVRRLHDWLPRITGASETRLFNRCTHTGYGRASSVSRFDLCLVLEGEQGCGKSSMVRNLCAGPGEEYFVRLGLIAMDNKTRAGLITGKWLVELAELSGMARSETEGVKAFLSQSSDQYRAPYAAVAVDRPRMCVFLASTNARSYLPDSTGTRRFLPVPCGRIELDALMSERNQLFAEAYLWVMRLTRDSRKRRETVSVVPYRTNLPRN